MMRMYRTPPSVRVSMRSGRSGLTVMDTSGVLTTHFFTSIRFRGLSTAPPPKDSSNCAPNCIRLSSDTPQLSSTSFSSSPLTTSGSSLFASCHASMRSLISCRTCWTTASEHSSSSALRSTPLKVSRCSSAGIGGWTWNSASMSG